MTVIVATLIAVTEFSSVVSLVSVLVAHVAATFAMIVQIARP